MRWKYDQVEPNAMPVVVLVCVAVAVHPLFLQGLLPHAYDLDAHFAPSWAFLAEAPRV
jgi:hypothetical protein